MTSDQKPLVSYDPDYGLATISGPGGFTQVPMRQVQAEAIAEALLIEFEVKKVIV